jgi:uncharacterized protein YdbL (DUF1318 family)
MKRSVLGIATTLLLCACVTINIYFPAAEAEQAADTIIRDIITEPASVPQDSSSMIWRGGASEEASVPALLEWLVPAAQAASADLNIDSPAIRRLRASMKKRFPTLQPHFDSGALGYSGDGLVAIRDAKAVPLKEKNALKKRVAAENKDRAALYAEIAKANGHPEWEKQIRETFARRWVANGRKGWWYQDGGAWKQK